MNSILNSTVFKKFLNLIGTSLKIAGIISFIMLVLAFTDVPYYAYHNLAMTHLSPMENPANIIVLGGDGMPSPSGLIRTYYAAEAGKKYSQAKLYIALPYNTNGELTQLDLMANELKLKGIEENRIQYEPNGFNTHSQANNLSQIIKNKDESLLIVSSPEHMYRAVKSFQKLGFTNVKALPTFEVPSDEEQLKIDKKNKKEKLDHLNLRYNVWSYLNYEILVLREYTAITYYKLKGWI